jgi:hypothetical protein
MNLRWCKYCAKRFVPSTHQRRVFCSYDCLKKYKKRKSENKRLERAFRESVVRSCKSYGADFLVKGGGPRKKFCSRRCLSRYHSATWRKCNPNYYAKLRQKHIKQEVCDLLLDKVVESKNDPDSLFHDPKYIQSIFGEGFCRRLDKIGEGKQRQ